ncbi:hypothetical protein COBT_000344 [Conglomerata obtusa]
MNIGNNKNIEIISKSQIRYTGTLKNYDKVNGLFIMCNVRSMGTESRSCLHRVPESANVYDALTFKVVNVQCYRVDGVWQTVELNSSEVSIDLERRDSVDLKRGIGEDKNYNVEGNNRDCRMYRNKRPSSTRRYRMNQAHFNAVIPEKEFDLNNSITDDAKINRDELKKSSKNFYDINTGFYDNFKS